LDHFERLQEGTAHGVDALDRFNRPYGDGTKLERQERRFDRFDRYNRRYGDGTNRPRRR
jgi:hypothetical protein